MTTPDNFMKPINAMLFENVAARASGQPSNDAIVSAFNAALRSGDVDELARLRDARIFWLGRDESQLRRNVDSLLSRAAAASADQMRAYALACIARERALRVQLAEALAQLEQAVDEFIGDRSPLPRGGYGDPARERLYRAHDGARTALAAQPAEPVTPAAAVAALRDIGEWDHRGYSVREHYDEIAGAGAFDRVLSALAAAPAEPALPAAQPAESGEWVPASTQAALTRFKAIEAKEDSLKTETPLERLRYFLSLALGGQDWLDVEQFLDALPAANMNAQPPGWIQCPECLAGFPMKDAQPIKSERALADRLAEALQFIANREDLTFAECTDAEEIIMAAKEALAAHREARKGET